MIRQSASKFPLGVLSYSGSSTHEEKHSSRPRKIDVNRIFMGGDV